MHIEKKEKKHTVLQLITPVVLLAEFFSAKPSKEVLTAMLLTPQKQHVLIGTIIRVMDSILYNIRIVCDNATVSALTPVLPDYSALNIKLCIKN